MSTPGSVGHANYAKSLDKIKAENDGKLPSDLYLQTNEQLANMLYDLTGRFAPPRTSKKILVARIEKATGASTSASVRGTKRKADAENASKKVQKAPRGCLASLTPGQIGEMKRMLQAKPEAMETYTHRELLPMWERMGVIARYPPMTAKAKVIDKMRAFATKNLEFHQLL